MLGTNELRNVYDNTAKQIGEMLEQYFVKTILNRKSQCQDTYPKLLIVAPPPVNEAAEYCKEGNLYLGASKKAEEVDEIYKEIAKKYNCNFLSTRSLETGIDGVHITKESHQKLAEALNLEIRRIYK
jgi:lysophospholipase L1-like esterase